MHTHLTIGPANPAVSAITMGTVGASANANASSGFHPAKVVMAPATLDPQDKKKLKDASVQLEATFNSFMMDELSKGLPGSEGDFGSQVYADMFKQTISTKLAESDAGKGIADQIYKTSVKSAIAHGGSRHLAAAADVATMGVSRDKSAMAYQAMSATNASTPTSL